MLTPENKRIIERVINTIETGNPNGDYDDVTLLHDDPNDNLQITYGRSQTTETGNLRALIVAYSKANGKYSEAFKTYVDGLGNNEIGRDRLSSNGELIALLRSAGKDPVMQQCQDVFFDEHYWNPALNFFEREGFTLPLSMLVIYDSYIQSGRVFEFLRNQFPEHSPAAGGDEKQWIEEYVAVRDAWLRGHRRPAVRTSAYRTSCYKGLIKRGNWNLESLPIIANGTAVS